MFEIIEAGHAHETMRGDESITDDDNMFDSWENEETKRALDLNLLHIPVKYREKFRQCFRNMRACGQTISDIST